MVIILVVVAGENWIGIDVADSLEDNRVQQARGRQDLAKRSSENLALSKETRRNL
jgi:hypothetical protein